MLKRSFLLCFIVFLAACAPAAPPHVTLRTDEFSKEIEVVGIAQFKNPFMTYNPYFWRLRTFINKDTHVFTHQVFFYTRYKGSIKTFKYADDDNAVPLKVTMLYKMDCMGSSCEKVEAIGIAVKDEQLRSREATGMRIRIRAKNGDNVILTFTPEMIRQQLDAVDKLVRQQ